LALDKDAPLSRTVKRAGRILCRQVLGGLHHEYVRDLTSDRHSDHSVSLDVMSVPRARLPLVGTREGGSPHRIPLGKLTIGAAWIGRSALRMQN
jgi:hypothetical protein